MGEKISIVDSLVITGFSMVVVFVGLIVLSFIISILKSMGKEKSPQPIEKKTKLEPTKTSKEDLLEPSQDDGELIAVISAAIAAAWGVNIPQVNIKSIKRLPQNTPNWSSAGRQEQIYGKL